MVFLSILADFCHQLLRDWTVGERLLLLLLLLLWIVVVLVVPLVFFFFFFATMMVLFWNFPNENLELIIEVEEKEEEGEFSWFYDDRFCNKGGKVFEQQREE